MNTPRVELLRLGSRIRSARAHLGYNQGGFATACSLNRTYFGGVERGERNVTFSVLCTICVALGCDVAALTAGIPDLTLTPPPPYPNLDRNPAIRVCTAPADRGQVGPCDP